MAGKEVPEAWIFRLILWVLAGVILGALVYWAAFSQPAAQQPAPPGTGTPQLPANSTVPVTAYLITRDDCTDCNASAFLARSLALEADSLGFSVTKTELADGSQPAQALIAKYNLTRLPALVVSSSAASSSAFEASWLGRLGTRESDGNYVYREVYPPYYDVRIGRAVGYVDYYEILPANCSACTNLTPMLDFLEGGSVLMAMRNRTTLRQGDAQAQALIAKYGITTLPSLVLGPDAAYYPIINYSWNVSGSVEPDGWLVHRKQFPPYLDIQGGAVRGVVDVVELWDPTCVDCYNNTKYRKSLEETFNFYFGNVSSVDSGSAEGMALAAKYNITAVPTILLSPDAALYANFRDVWLKAGNTVEPDGWLAFRAMESLGARYRNITKAAAPNATN